MVIQVLLHVPGDREAVIKYLDKSGIKYKYNKFGNLLVQNTFIELEKYGSFGNRLEFHPDSAKEYAGKPVTIIKNPNLVYGNKFLSYNEQVKLFNTLKRAIMKSRAEYYKKTEKVIEQKKEGRIKKLKQLQEVIDFEKNVLRREHQLEEQIKKTINFLVDLQKDIPKFTYKEDFGEFDKGISNLKEILDYLKEEAITTVYILKHLKEPVQIKKQKKRIKIQKKHLKKLSTKLNFIAGVMKYQYRGIRNLQVTTSMRKHLKEFYGQIYQTYEWYAKFFKKEAKK